MALDKKQATQPKQVFLRKKKLQTQLEHVTQEMYRRNLELAETNKTLSLLRKIDSLVLESRDSLQVLCSQLTDAIALATDFPFVALLVEPPHKKNYMEVYGISTTTVPSSAPALQPLKSARLSTDHAWLQSEKKLISFNFNEISNHQLKEFLECSTQEAKLIHSDLPLQTVYMIKLTARQQLVGALIVGFLHPQEQMSPADQELFERLSEAVGVAVDNKLLFEENQLVLSQLQKTNVKLRELDQAKDEFISMASHQLRTPLTSVKGYISMVLDGDAGKLIPSQRKLLDQAFLSSQRMVYLIADLLNVSRLHTGKFIIEAKPTNLAEVIEGEVSQLVQAAKNRKLTLIYKKPKDFPELMMDETKIRQVVMNFVDNALYYTPSGGHVTINLVETPKSVEFTVADDGIGIPKKDQHHLFTKFYRAGNARKARPDGTGLGLFMAKKVVMAQGGAIIFKSQENKGSTFGFIFSKEKLKALKT